ncbi:MAG: type IV toxin-antitoxin system AbiEi family antitoxin [Gammaproteobacteria bacterium]|nr:type IV toxin-antitoxin system AbiEi family antitoxin [Gammaproteobacteria bacterium]
MKHLSDYIDTLKARGEFCFTSEQALEFLNISKEALQMSLIRLRHKKQLVTLSKYFHLIILPEYQSIGCLPPDHFISAYMKFLGLPYYVCLLSAAGYYGAAHQKPQVFQVITNKQLRPIKCGKVSIYFSFKRDMSDIQTKVFNVPTGYIKVSTPEVTAMDLFCYQKSSGGINHIATVLTELIAMIDPEKLLQVAIDSGETAWVQRLGYVLEQLEPIEVEHRNKIVTLLKKYISDKKPAYVLLLTKGLDENVKNSDWKLIVNCKIESDI